MKTTLILGLVLFAGLCSCKKATNQLSLGAYLESMPASGRSGLNFVSKTLVIKTETGSPAQDSFYYRLSGGSIILTPAWTNQYPGSPFDFRVIDDHTIQIGNIFPQIPEAPKSYIIYKK